MFAFVAVTLLILIMVVGAIIVLTRASLRFKPEPYTYAVDANGNEYVKDNTDA